ncbi:MAG: Hsp20/alpha crystallin family protein [Candidatus Omnitrophica bacterium]|nr:Hsp20/alpha crystallin family protein [Candidatus Omnitrophota bacterium]
MALIKWQGKEWDPFRELMDLQRDIDNLFNASWERLPARLSQEATWLPSLDVAEDKDNIVIKVDLPGVKQSDIDVSVSGDILTIKGERKQEQEIKEKKLHRIERFYGSFSRSLSLPDFVDSSKISAVYKDGVLEVTLPKTEKAKPKQIKVEVK